jgi:hypothetical protein
MPLEILRKPFKGAEENISNGFLRSSFIPVGDDRIGPLRVHSEYH